MGAQIVEGSSRAKTINKAWNNLYEQAEEYSGHQEGYSGDFNTCQFTKDVSEKLNTMSIRQLNAYIEDNVPKREAWGYCIKKPVSNQNKVKSKVTPIVQKGARTWVTVYEAIDFYGNIVESASTLTACIKKARAYVEKNTTRKLEIVISKRLQSGNHKCSIIEYKNSTTESDGQYYFIGLASC